MVAQDEVYGARKHLLYLCEEWPNRVRLPRVTGQKNDIWVGFHDRTQEGGDLVVIEEIEMDVLDPGCFHGRPVK